MFVWDWLGGDAAVGTVVPEAYAAYRPPITAALRFFVEQLPADRAFAILADQMALGRSAGVSERLMTLARGCPVLHKLGQVLARDRRLDLELREQLQRLESMEPTVPIAELRARLERELGPLERLGIELEPEALAEASVAVVVSFHYRNGDDGQPGRGVFKLLKPGIEERLDQELALLERVGTFLDERCAEFGIPAMDYQEIFAQVRELLGEEVRLDGEQRHLTEARVAYEGWERTVEVPRPLPWSTPRVTAMERIDGRKVTDVEGDPVSPLDRVRLARRIVDALIVHPICSTAPTALFHADPHAGNLMVTPDGRLALLDWSLVGRLGERERDAMVQVLLGALTLDAPAVLDALRGLSDRPPDEPALERVVADHLRRLGRGCWPGFHWLTGLLDEAVQEARLRVGADLLMFRKMLLTLEGVVADVSAGTCLNIDALLTVTLMGRLAAEWPARAFAAPDSRSFSTRLSNTDLMRVALALPWTTARIGLDWWGEVLASGGAASP